MVTRNNHIQGTDTEMRDSEIEQWVLNEICLRTNCLLKEVCVFSTNGVVSLKGTVPSRADKLAVQEAAARAKGVAGVVNQLSTRRKRTIDRSANLKKQRVPVAARFQLPNPKSASTTSLAS